jgi:D-amino-acid oxidase
LRVVIYAREITPYTTSDVAAAYWAPGAALGGGRMQGWAMTSLAAFHDLTKIAASGIRLNTLIELSEHPLQAPHGSLPLPMTDLPSGRFPAPWSGFSVVVPQIDVPIYMPWLFQHFLSLGGQVQRMEMQQISELTDQHRIIINCTGLGAQRLTGDVMFPVRGQVIRIRKPPHLPPEMISAEADDEITYIIPRSQDCLLGGTYHYGDGRTEVDREIAAGILARCAQFYPALRKPEIIEHRVGLRPGRRQVRLEMEQIGSDTTVIHNYGHAALGHTLSWGCAAEVAALVQRL